MLWFVEGENFNATAEPLGSLSLLFFPLCSKRSPIHSLKDFPTMSLTMMTTLTWPFNFLIQPSDLKKSSPLHHLTHLYYILINTDKHGNSWKFSKQYSGNMTILYTHEHTHTGIFYLFIRIFYVYLSFLKINNYKIFKNIFKIKGIFL